MKTRRMKTRTERDRMRVSKLKCVTITIDIDVWDDTPEHVIEWMGDNLGEHAAQEFERDYEPEWTGFDRPPVAGDVTHTVGVRERSPEYVKAVRAERALRAGTPAKEKAERAEVERRARLREDRERALYAEWAALKHPTHA